MGDGTAQPLNGRIVRVRMPASLDARVGFLADVENLAARPWPRPPPRSCINARTGSVVMNQAVTRGTPAPWRTATCR